MSSRTSRDAVASALLHGAAAAGIKIGTDGDGLLLLKPREMSRETSFERALAEYQKEIIRIILQENAVRTGATS
jgi:hypothetical protein